MKVKDKERLRRVFGDADRSPQESEVLIWLADGITLHTVNKAKGGGKANGRNGSRSNKRRRFK